MLRARGAGAPSVRAVRTERTNDQNQYKIPKKENDMAKAKKTVKKAAAKKAPAKKKAAAKKK
jgi:hypothetical protein